MPPDPGPSRLDAITQDAITLLRRGRADLAAPMVQEMCGMLADRPELARQMQRILALMSFEWPAARSAGLPGRATAAPLPSDIELVAFHASAPADARLPSFDYAELLLQLFDSARLRAPAARRVLLTDMQTQLPHFGSEVEVRRFPIDSAHLMYERMRIQHEHLRARPATAATVFVDSDVIVNLEPSAIFSEAFDVGLTHRAVVDAPFNGGVIFAAPGAGAGRFFAKALECYGAMADAPSIAPLYPRSLRCWWGDQFALAALVGWRALGERGDGEMLTVDGLRVRIFPCDTHNYTIEARAYAPDELAAKYFIHFKGARKQMMEPYMATLRSQT